MAVHTLSLRVPEEVYRTSVEIARRRNISFNALVQQQLQRAIEEEMDREMYEAATLLGEDAQMCDMEYAIHMQAEVMLNHEP